MKVLGEVGFDQTVTEIKKLRSKVSELQQIIDNSEIGMGYIDCTYAEALELANDEKLNAGYRYRINDYEPCVRESMFAKEVGTEDKVKIYPFLTALSTSEFDRNCTFQVETKYQGIIEVSGQYSFNNYVQANGMDELLMTWVDPEKHKGVITRIDSPIGKVPFDYYNIQLRMPSASIYDTSGINNYFSFNYGIQTPYGVVVNRSSDLVPFAVGVQYTDYKSYLLGQRTEPTSLSTINLYGGQKIYASADGTRIYASAEIIDPLVCLDGKKIEVGTDLADCYMAWRLATLEIAGSQVTLTNPNWAKSDIVGAGGSWNFYIPDVLNLPSQLTSLNRLKTTHIGSPIYFPAIDKDNTSYAYGDATITFKNSLSVSDDEVDATLIKSIDFQGNLNIVLQRRSDDDVFHFNKLTGSIGKKEYTIPYTLINNYDYEGLVWVYDGEIYYVEHAFERTVENFIANSTTENVLNSGRFILKCNTEQTTANVVSKYTIVESIDESIGATLTNDEVESVVQNLLSMSSLHPANQPYGVDVEYPDCIGGAVKKEIAYEVYEWTAQYGLYLPTAACDYWDKCTQCIRDYLGLNIKTLSTYKPSSGKCEIQLENGKTTEVLHAELAYKLHHWLGCENINKLQVSGFDFGEYVLHNIKTPDYPLFHANLPRDTDWDITVSLDVPTNNSSKKYGYKWNGSNEYILSFSPSSESIKCEARLNVVITATDVNNPLRHESFATEITFEILHPRYN